MPLCADRHVDAKVVCNGRYQCDGFFTGMAPPWYDVDDPASAVTGFQAASNIVSPDSQADNYGPPSPIEPAAEWTPVWKGAWEGMARTDPQAHWLYQGWAIRGWNNAKGASRLKALFDVVPKGQWIVSDMDVNGIWRYFGNYSFFGAPFVWTTLHDFGGNDGLKGLCDLITSMHTVLVATLICCGAR